MTEITRATPADAGCWIEGSRGWTGSAVLVRKAQGWGMPLNVSSERFLAAYEAGEGAEDWRCGLCGFKLSRVTLTDEGGWVHLHDAGKSYVDDGILPHDPHPCDTQEAILGQGELVDQTEEWLNEHIAPEGYAFGWHDGEFFLWTTDEWEEQS